MVIDHRGVVGVLVGVDATDHGDSRGSLLSCWIRSSVGLSDGRANRPGGRQVCDGASSPSSYQVSSVRPVRAGTLHQTRSTNRTQDTTVIPWPGSDRSRCSAAAKSSQTLPVVVRDRGLVNNVSMPLRRQSVRTTPHRPGLPSRPVNTLALSVSTCCGPRIGSISRRQPLRHRRRPAPPAPTGPTHRTANDHPRRTSLRPGPSANRTTHHVHLPQLHRGRPFPALEPCSRRRCAAGTTSPSRTNDRYILDPDGTTATPPPAQLRHKPPRPPQTVHPPQLHHHRLHLGRHLLRIDLGRCDPWASPANPRAYTGPTTHAPSAGTPPTGRRPRSPAGRRANRHHRLITLLHHAQLHHQGLSRSAKNVKHQPNTSCINRRPNVKHHPT